MIKNDLETLLKLQEIDIKVDKLEAGKVDIPKMLDEQKANLKNSQDNLLVVKKEMESAQKDRKMLEIEFESKNTEIKKLQGQLFNLRSNKEYSAMQQEINHSKESSSKAEEEIITCMLKEDEIRKKVVLAQEDIKKEEEKLKVLENECSDELKKIDEELVKLRGQREEMTAGIESKKLYESYNNIRESLGGIGIVKVEGNICSGCNISLRPQTIIEIMNYEQEVCCENCGRILYN